jgi:hypothetical protein
MLVRSFLIKGNVDDHVKALSASQKQELRAATRAMFFARVSDFFVAALTTERQILDTWRELQEDLAVK